MKHLTLVLALFCWAANALAIATDGLQDNIPEKVRRIPSAGIDVPEDRALSLRTSLQQLQQKITDIRGTADAARTSLLPDVMIFERAVRCALDYNEFFDVQEFDKADALLKTGLERAEQLLSGKPAWINQKGLVVRGYISRIDQTVQPYGLVIPPTYSMDHSVQTRCDLWFHGRGEQLTEVNFLWDRMHNRGEFTPDHTIVLHPYGRYCNAFKFAGEIDVLEALNDLKKGYRIDEERISVRGFSMGGAACWQFATHYSDRWFAASPGAGFSETPQFLKVFQKEDLKPRPWEQTLWSLYDCDKWALNLTHCPTTAYSGENDSQKQAADVMEKALAEHGITLKHVIGAGMGHRYDQVSKDLLEKNLASLAVRGRMDSPPLIRLTTYSLRYNQMKGAQIDGMLEHWKPAQLTVWCRETEKPGHPAHLLVHTTNVSAFSVNFSPGQLDLSPETLERLHHPNSKGLLVEVVSSEDQHPEKDPHIRMGFLHVRGPFSDGSMKFEGHRDETGTWKDGPSTGGLRKKHQLHGPVDDALMDSFVFVRPTGTAANTVVGQWVETELTRAIEHWRRHFRGDVRIIPDTEVTDEIMQTANLILWGDPQSNSVMGRVSDKLPVLWTKDQIRAGNRTWDAAHHAPILIYPNPLNPERYVVFNSSFTFRDFAYLNNARQVPMLPDWAIIDLRTPPNSIWPGNVVEADFFNEQWQLKK